MRTRGRNFFLKYFFSLFFLALAFFNVHVCAATEILNVRHWTAPDHTRIVLDVDSVPHYKAIEEEQTLVLHLQNTHLHASIPWNISLNKPGIRKMTFQQIHDDLLQIDFHLDRHQKIDVFKLRKFQDKPDRIVVDVFLEETPPETPIKLKMPEIRKKKRIIVLDPGHGGEDPGAIGTKGTYEKDIVLQISREIQREINKISGFSAVLTRDGDYYVSFNKRLKKARDLNASLFLSIHADAARSRLAKGSSVYCLSTGAASSEAARLLANNENLSDILGGVPENETNNESNQILMNMFQTNTINLSKIYAEVLIKHLENISCMKYEIVQEAPFRVLKLPDIPAVLIETAYLSNPQEEKLLKKKDFQKRIAQAISSSIEDYFSSTIKVEEKDEIRTTIYTVKKGDTLFLIAKRFKTDIKTILDFNNLQVKDKLFIGQKMIVPEDETIRHDLEKENPSRVPQKKVPPPSYTVKKGDTLFLIAKRFNTSVRDLMALNNMKLGDKLFIGRKIIIPADESQRVMESDKNKTNPERKNKKAPGYYTVKKGDTLLSIAQKHATTVSALLKANHMKLNDKLLHGQRIKIP
jgi:N-acetylmuramoyl-L-alanine amidase